MQVPHSLSLCAVLGALALPVHAQETGTAFDPSVERRIELENGAVVVLRSYPEAELVAAEALYDRGFVHEPAGMTQAAHLLEHLVASGATESYERGEALAYLSSVGLGNAETLADWTHYDYVVPRADLEKVLALEVERLTSLTFGSGDVRTEAAKCYQETDFVEANPLTGMLKHAFMAFAQSWRHGRNEALVRGGLEELDLEALGAYRRAVHRPEALTLVLVGGFELEAAEELVREHVGAVPPSDAPRVPTIDWDAVAPRATVTWDAAPRAICIAWRPPADADDRFLFTWMGSTLRQKLASDPRIRAAVEVVHGSDHLYAVGELPFFVYALLRPDADLDEVEELMLARIDAWLEEGPTRGLRLQIPLKATAWADRAQARWLVVADNIQFSAKQLRKDPSLIAPQVLGQQALERAVLELRLGPDPRTMIPGQTELTQEGLAELIRATLTEERRFVTRLVPRSDGEATR
jgi:predicted Zn-dependent peptidase